MMIGNPEDDGPQRGQNVDETRPHPHRLHVEDKIGTLGGGFEDRIWSPGVRIGEGG